MWLYVTPTPSVSPDVVPSSGSASPICVVLAAIAVIAAIWIGVSWLFEVKRG